MKLIAAIFLFLLFVSPSQAESDYKECFEKLQAPYQSWNALFEFRKKGECLSGAVYSEIWSDQITLLLANHWQLLPQLSSIAAPGSTERAFVLKSIDETCPFDRCLKIKKLSINNCPPGLDEICSQIRQRIGNNE